jgi:membrane protease YdiL (CAAX protease family)
MRKLPAIEGAPMDSEIQPQIAETKQSGEQSPAIAPEPLALTPDAEEYRGLKWIFIGSEGLRAGWSVLIFVSLVFIFTVTLGVITYWFVHYVLSVKLDSLSAAATILEKSIEVISLFSAAAIMARIEGRHLRDYNFSGSRRPLSFLSGLVAGFVALSALIGTLVWGGWLHFGQIALAGPNIFIFAAEWGLAFILVAFSEEGSFRCYLQFTLTRGINFWWALGVEGAVCAALLTIRLVTGKDGGFLGVYVIAALGLLPCLLLHLKKNNGSGFWQAAWVTSTLFGAIHTGNNGENWIGIFAAAAIGFVFCVSVRLTGSAWWAIGCHAAWDWAETYFYGTADSGFVFTGHYLSCTATGNPLWSGGTDGPEGSILVIPTILLIWLVLLVVYARKPLIPAPVATPQLEQAA